MANADGEVKRTSRLAVFEHVEQKPKNPKKRKFRTNRLELDDSSPSESELVIDEEPAPVKTRKHPLVRLTEEVLNLHCEWSLCDDSFDSWREFNKHILEHVPTDTETFNCKWDNCEVSFTHRYLLTQHVSYHGYLSKLKNVGQNILDRNNWPKCTVKESYKIPITLEGYTCLWEYCSQVSFSVYDFYTHMEIHVKNNPRVANKKLKEIIQCCWEGCKVEVGDVYKLAEHVRTHTKERVIACPTCCTLFANKTKFCDHRNRQLATDLQSYQCSQCLKLFPNERLLREHMRSHINQYKCTMCDMTCPKPSVLAKHIRFKHINYKSFKCPECSAAFVAKHNLVTHLRTHSKKLPLQCDQCNFACRSKNGLDAHNEKAHGKSRAIYQCHCCKRQFLRGGYLTKHLVKVHNYHWPSGHSRFRYLKDQDGVHRLQMVRYESLEVTEEMLKSEAMAPSKSGKGNYNPCDGEGNAKYVLSVSEKGEQWIKVEEVKKKDIVITIDDVDEKGNVIESNVMESGGTVDINIKGEHIQLDNFEGKSKCAKGGKRGRKRKRAVSVSESASVEKMEFVSEDTVLNYDKSVVKSEVE